MSANLIKEYRDSMPPGVMRAWAKDAITEPNRQQSIIRNGKQMIAVPYWFIKS